MSRPSSSAKSCSRRWRWPAARSRPSPSPASPAIAFPDGPSIPWIDGAHVERRAAFDFATPAIPITVTVRLRGSIALLGIGASVEAKCLVERAAEFALGWRRRGTMLGAEGATPPLLFGRADALCEAVRTGVIAGALAGGS